MYVSMCVGVQDKSVYTSNMDHRSIVVNSQVMLKSDFSFEILFTKGMLITNTYGMNHGKIDIS